jgi:chromosome segregation ATPase
MKKRMTELETQIALQSENFNKISMNSNIKEEKLNNDITDYINQINDLKNEMEVLNNIITNLTEEKENNAIKITNLLHENEKLKQNIKNNANSGANGGGTSNGQSGEGENSKSNKKYEEIILKLKKNMLNLKEEKEALVEVILKQESEVNQLSSNVNEVENILMKKDKELQESIEYSAKLTSSINFHKNEIIRIKQKQSQSDNNKNDKNSETIINLQKELQNMKKNLEEKESKLNVLLTNNKALQDKLNKLTQVIKNELNCNNGNNSKYNNKNKISIFTPH